MLEKAKKFFLYIAAPVAFVFGFIYYLLTQNSSLKRKLEASEAGRKLEKTKGEMEKIDEKATDSYADYKRLRDEYDSTSGPKDSA